MTELEQAIAAITKATSEKNPWSVADFADDPSNAPEIDAHIATILNAVATGQLVPAQGWQSMDSAPRDGTDFLALDSNGWIFTCWCEDEGEDGLFWVNCITGDNEEDIVGWMPRDALPPPPAEGV
ncbi:hypothetical protein [Paenirhodobacter enshiensis]|uniref:hypothetical protein n=1 Tax=Paenirhodobacter enshiensis TaxID=1105367 RepID=UPI0035B24573